MRSDKMSQQLQQLLFAVIALTKRHPSPPMKATRDIRIEISFSFLSDYRFVPSFLTTDDIACSLVCETTGETFITMTFSVKPNQFSV
jgi:hypothetical protein